MFRTETLGFVFKMAALIAVAILGYCVVNGLQHWHITELYKVAGTF